MTGLRLELFVADIERSVAFYRRVLGFLVERRTDPRYVPVRRGGARLGLGARDILPADHPLRAGTGQVAGLGVEIVVEVDDLDAAHEQVVRSGHRLAAGIAEQPWGLWDFRLHDPDGYYLRVTELPR